MTVGSVILWSLGILAVLALLCLLDMWLGKRKLDMDYDERQRLVRGDAWRLSATVGIFYILALFACLELDVALPLSTPLLLFVGMMIQVTAFHIYCLIQKAALPLGKNGWWMVVLDGLLGFVNLNAFRNRLKILHVVELAQQEGVALFEEPYPMDAALEDAYMSLLVAVLFLSLAAMHLISMVWPERE